MYINKNKLEYQRRKMSEAKLINAALLLGADMDPFTIVDGPRSISKLRFDGYGTHPDLFRPFALEYDGIWHFVPHYTLKGIEPFKSYLVRDRIKNKWCVENDWHLLRIPYTISSDNFESIVKEFLAKCTVADEAGDETVQLFWVQWMYDHQNTMYPDAKVDVPINDKDPDDNEKIDYHKLVLHDECADDIVKFMEQHSEHNCHRTKRDRAIVDLVKHFGKIEPDYWPRLSYKTFKSPPTINVDLIKEFLKTLSIGGSTWDFDKTTVQTNKNFLIKLAADVLDDQESLGVHSPYQVIIGAIYRLVNHLLNAKVVVTQVQRISGTDYVQRKDKRIKSGFTTRRQRIKIPHYKIVFGTDKHGLTVMDWIAIQTTGAYS
jgi:hypothetical protein